MTLRAEIRSAIDEVAPPVPELRSRALAILEADRRLGSGSAAARKPMRPFLVGIKHAGAIAAVLIVVLLVVAFFVGGRVLQDWRQFNSPKPVGITFEQALDDLRSRAISLPVLKPSDTCPVTPSTSTFHYGSGPVYADGGGPISTSWGTYFDVSWYTTPRLTGPVLIRARDLRSNRQIIFVGSNAGGPVVGRDVINGSNFDQHAELILDAGHPPHRLGSPYEGFGWWPIRQGVSNGWSHCFGFQIDAPTFSETMTGNG